MKNHNLFSKSLSLFMNGAIMVVLMTTLVGQAGATRLVPPTATITVWHSDTDTTMLDQVVSDFQALYPSITVQLDYKDTATLLAEFKQQVSSGGGPELVRGWNDLVGSLAAQGLIRPVDAEVDLDDFVPQAVDGALWNGQHWGVPETYGNHLMLFYNKSLLASAPTNTTDMINVAKGLTGGGQYGLVYILNEPFWLIPWLTGFGGWVLDEGADPVMPTLDTPAMVNALQFVHDLLWVHGIVPSGTVDYGTADNLFLNGNAAMMINGDWTFRTYRAHFGANLGVARIPLVTATAEWPRPMVNSKYYMLNKNSSGAALAASQLFIEFATSKAEQLLWPQKMGILPALLEAYNDPLVQTDPIMQASADQASIGRLTPTAAEMSCVWEALFVQIPLVRDNQTTPTAAAAALQAQAANCAAELHKVQVYLPLVSRPAAIGYP